MDDVSQRKKMSHFLKKQVYIYIRVLDLYDVSLDHHSL